MRALVISGGGSKGAFAGGVAQYLIDEMNLDYDLFVGTSTGSLLISHLALDKVSKIKTAFTSVNQNSIFSSCPFTIKRDKFGGQQIGINHITVLKNFIKGKKTFGESFNLRKLIEKT
ncbi:MAG TPA: patatin-like phospholipase family protein, partial [Aequorivita sp.]|nr:patatin-like phospholipase family protein [Aequorivita sp.]